MFRYKTVLTLFIFSGVLSGCGNSANKTLDELNRNRAKWESANIHTYQFEYRVSCFCLDEYTLPRLVFVDADQVVSQTVIDTHVALPLDDNNAMSITALFERIALEESRAESLSVEYDPELGYPTLVQVDENKQIADDEYTLYVSNVVNADEVGCTASVVNGLSIKVTDDSTQLPAACGVTVTATDDNYSETFTNNDAACDDSDAISMLSERPGFYSVTLQKSGYQAFQADDFGIGRDICHVLPRQLDVTLTPE